MVFSKNCIEQRRSRTAKKLSSHLKPNEFVLVYAGQPYQKPGGFDQNHSFIPHPDYFWISGQRRAGGVALFSTGTGWVDYVHPIHLEESIWENSAETPVGKDVKELKNFLSQQKGARFCLLGLAPQNFEFPAFSVEENRTLHEQFSQERRQKDSEEVALVRQLAGMAHQGYKKLQTILRADISERALQIEYEAEVFRAGAERMPYETIIGSGVNASFLHAIPTSKKTQDGELLLIDAGADLYHYCVDITRVYAVNGQFTTQQKAIYSIVKSAQEAGIQMCHPGVEWKDIHLKCAHIMADGLRSLNILTVTADEAVASGAISAFFPHGIGHMVGLQVRDAGGPYNPNPKSYAGSRIRVDMKIEENFLMTVEPGLYFIESLLYSPDIQSKYKSQINWTEVQKWLKFGGVRIEDDILFTRNGPENLTSAVEKFSF